MSVATSHTEAFRELRTGGHESLDQLSVMLYAELREIAHRHRVTRDDGNTLVTTALVHEAYLTLVERPNAHWNDRAHFLALAAVVMRHILADRAKARMALKRGGAEQAVTFEEEIVAAHDRPDALLDVNEALERLSRIDARLATVVECRFFGGLTNEEIASALGVTVRTVERDWMKARMLLRVELAT